MKRLDVDQAKAKFLNNAYKYNLKEFEIIRSCRASLKAEHRKKNILNKKIYFLKKNLQILKSQNSRILKHKNSQNLPNPPKFQKTLQKPPNMSTYDECDLLPIVVDNCSAAFPAPVCANPISRWSDDADPAPPS